MKGWGLGRDKVSGKAGSLGGILEDLPGMDNCFLAPTNDGVRTTLTTQRSCFVELRGRLCTKCAFRVIGFHLWVHAIAMTGEFCPKKNRGALFSSDACRR